MKVIEIFKAHQMGDFTVEPCGYVGRPKEYKDTGCERAKKLNYKGKCIECPLLKCLEDS